MATSSKRNSIFLIIACFVVYMFTTTTKSNYTASVAYIVNRGIFSKESSGLIGSAFYVFYGIGQAFGGVVVDRVSPYKMILVGIIGALVTNLLLCFTTNFYAVLVIWSISGLSQFAIWPGVCKIVSTDVSPQDRNMAVYILSYGLTVSGLLSYIFSATILEGFGWSSMFLTSTVIVLISLIIWIIAMSKKPEKIIIEEDNKKVLKKQNNNGFFKAICLTGMIFLLIDSFTRSMLTTGAKIWIPTMIMESYNLSSKIASFGTIFLMLLQMIGLIIFGKVLKHSKRPVVGAVTFCLIELIPLIVLLFIGVIPVSVAVIMMAVQSVAISLVAPYINQIAIRFDRFGFGGTYVGLANSFASFGVVLASSLYGIIAGKYGWRTIIILWIALTLICILCYLLKLLFEKIFKMEEKINE